MDEKLIAQILMARAAQLAEGRDELSPQDTLLAVMTGVVARLLLRLRRDEVITHEETLEILRSCD
jgi:hypothetical protein